MTAILGKIFITALILTPVFAFISQCLQNVRQDIASIVFLYLFAISGFVFLTSAIAFVWSL